MEQPNAPTGSADEHEIPKFAREARDDMDVEGTNSGASSGEVVKTKKRKIAKFHRTHAHRNPLSNANFD